MALLATVLLTACSVKPGFSLEPSFGSASSSGDKDTFTIGMSISTLNNPFFVALSENAEAKAKELGADTTVVDAQDNASKQASDIEDLIQQNVDLMIINPVDSAAVAAAVASANAAGIPVITSEFGTRGIEDKSTFIIAEKDTLAKAINEFDLKKMDAQIVKARERQEILKFNLNRRISCG